MIEQILLLSLAVPIGLLSGLAIGIPGSIALLLSYPLLIGLEFDFILSYYLIIAITTQFTNSVMGIYTGIPGDITAIPVVTERKNLVKNFSIEENLFRTSMASIVGVAAGIIFLFLLFNFFSIYTNQLLRTEVMFFFLVLIIIISVFWNNNRILINAILVLAGLVIGSVGYHSSIQTSILSFGNPFLLGGLPFISGFVAMYAVPNIISLKSLYKESCNTTLYTKKNRNTSKSYSSNFDYLIGIMCGLTGLIPLIGSSMSSNLAYFISKKITDSSLRRAITSETSNSFSHVIVLGPLLFYGVAIVPSEMILLNVLTSKGWNLDWVTEKTILLLCLTTIIVIPMCHYASTRISESLVRFLIRYVKVAIPILLILLIYNIYYIGSLTAETEVYVATFILFSLIGVILYKLKVSCLPMIFSWAVTDSIITVTHRMLLLYA